MKPDKRDEVERRAMEWRSPEGITERGYWVDLSGRRVFYLYETDDPKAILEANHYWSDIVKIYTFQLMDAKEAMECMPMVYSEFHELDIAIDTLNRCINIVPLYSNACDALGVAYGRQGRLKEAARFSSLT